MKSLDINAYGVKEMNKQEMVETNGGIGVVVALLLAATAVIAAGCTYNETNNYYGDNNNNGNNSNNGTGNGNGNGNGKH